MKKLTHLVVTCLFAGVAIAQPADDKPAPKNKKGKGQSSEEKAAPGEAKANAKPAAQAPARRPEARKAPAAPRPEKRAAPVAAKKPAKAPAAPVAKENQPRPEARAAADKPGKKPATRKDNPAARSVDAPENRAAANPEAPKNRSKAERAKAQAAKARNAEAPNAEARSAAAERSNPPSADNNRNSDTPRTSPERRAAAQARRPAPEKVQEIRARHQNFRAEPRPDRVPTVTFTENRRIENSDRWRGPRYEAFRSYRPERHDEGWYRSRYDRIELISGGYYYRRDNYWYPAWGYQPTAEYYAYDGPIYVGQRADPPDRVIADVQAALQEMDYYKGEVDGLLGPLTREALTGYQTDQGLEITAAIDEPTLDELGLQ